MICHVFILPFVVNSAKNLSIGALNIIYITDSWYNFDIYYGILSNKSVLKNVWIKTKIMEISHT